MLGGLPYIRKAGRISKSKASSRSGAERESERRARATEAASGDFTVTDVGVDEDG